MNRRRLKFRRSFSPQDRALKRETARLKAELNKLKKELELTRKNEERYRMIFENSGQGILVGAGGYIRMANNRAQEITGYSLDELGSKSLYDFLHPDDRSWVLELGFKAMRGEPTPEKYEYRGVNPDGDIVWVESSSVVINWEGMVGAVNFISDITQRKNTEFELSRHRDHLSQMIRERTKELEEACWDLRVSEEKFRSLYNNAPIPAFLLLEKEGSLVLDAYNQAADALTMGMVKGWLGRQAEKICRDHPELFNFLIKSRRSRLPRVSEFKFRDTLNKERLILQVAVAQIPPEIVLVYVQDITKGKLAEEKLLRSETLFRTLAETTATGIAVTTETKALYVNSAAMKIMDVAEKQDIDFNEILNLNAMEPNIKMGVIRKIRALVQGRINLARYIIKTITNQKRIKCIDCTSTRTIYEGQPVILTSFMDITEQRKAIKALQASEEQLRSLMETAEDFVVFRLEYTQNKSRACDVVFISPSARELLGLSDPMNFRQWAKLLHPDDVKKVKTGRRNIRQGRKFNQELRIFNQKKNEWRWVQAICIGVFNENKELVFANGIILDISDRKKTEQNLKDYQDRLRALASELTDAEEKERRRIAVDLHDRVGQTLAFSLNRIKLLAELNRSEPLKSELDKIGAFIRQTIHDTRTLTFDLSPPVLYDLGLGPALEWLSEEISESYDFEVRYSEDKNLKPLDKHTEIILFRAARELLINAVKHSQAQGAMLSFSRDNSAIRIKVEDHGVGMPPPVGDQILYTGLGFFSIRERLEPLGGSLQIESELNRGAAFTLVVPLSQHMETAGK